MTSLEFQKSFGVRRQSAAATALWFAFDVMHCRGSIQSAVAAALCRRTPKFDLSSQLAYRPRVLTTH
ncbi:MAG: hypothetical protein DMF74_01335 [Acidobacteria bacterium]|nr:MAG: hypothetical protein DMF74_01335 [Acidobacteriota bacterium]